MWRWCGGFVYCHVSCQISAYNIRRGNLNRAPRVLPQRATFSRWRVGLAFYLLLHLDFSAHLHFRPHTPARTYLQFHTNANFHSHLHTPTHLSALPHTFPPTLPLTHTRASIYTSTHTYPRIYLHFTHISTIPPIHTHTPIYTYHTCAHTHTPTHLSMRPNILSLKTDDVLFKIVKANWFHTWCY